MIKKELQQELNRTKLVLDYARQEIKEKDKEIERLNKRVKEAIEYIEEKYDYILGDDTFLDHDERIDRKQINHIIEILKGSDKE